MWAKRRPFSMALAAAAALVAVAGIALRLVQPENIVDDAYITFRHVRNLLAGAGLVYNPGESVLGTSAPGYALLLAAMSGLSGASVTSVAILLNALCDGACIVLILVLVRSVVARAGMPEGVAAMAGVAAGGLWALDARSIDFSTGGMEAPIFTLLILGAATAMTAGRTWPAAFLAGASVWIRPDGALVILALLIALAVARRALPLQEMAAAALPALLFAGWAVALYGDPVPASVRAKWAGAYTLPADHALRYLFRHLAGLADPNLPAGELLPFLRASLREYVTLAAGALLPGGLALIGFVRGRAQPAVLFLGLYAAIFLAAFAAGNPFMMGWYYVPLEASYVILMVIGGAWLAEAARTRGWGLPLAPGARRGLVAGLLLLALLRPQLARYHWGPVAPGVGVGSIRSEWEKNREREYLAVGTDLARLTGGRARLAAPEIGALGYAYPGPLLDTVGLVSPEARAHYPLPRGMVAGNSAIPPDLIAEERPELVVFLEIFGRKGLLLDPRFGRDYVLLRRYRSRVFGSRDLLVYRRRDALW